MPCRGPDIDADRVCMELGACARGIVWLGECVPGCIEVTDSDRRLAENPWRVVAWTFTLDQMTRRLCSALRGLPEEDRERALYDGRSAESRHLAGWWGKHAEDDRRRVEGLKKEISRLEKKMEIARAALAYEEG